MIGKLELLEGYATKLERLKTPVEFKPGLNILFGENGCGKSSLLKIAAAYCGIDTRHKNAGWSKFIRPFIVGKKSVFPDIFQEICVGECKAKVEWDGTPTLLADPSVTDSTQTPAAFFEAKDSADGMTGMHEQLNIMFNHPSSGELRMNVLYKYYHALKNPPCIDKVSDGIKKSHNDVWVSAYQKFADYVKSLSRTGPVTIMLDEPDRSLSIQNQSLFWLRFIPKLVSDKYQVIVATHSVFCLFKVFTEGSKYKANWIEFEPGSVAKARTCLGELQKDLFNVQSP